MPQGITILGSTGSVGESTLDVISRNFDRYRVIALSAYSNVDRLARQCARFNSEFAVIGDESLASKLSVALKEHNSKAKVLAGPQGLAEAATLDQVDMVMAAIVGAAGLTPTLKAAEAGKRILLANKEALVIAGHIFMEAARNNGATVLPVDSEHNAIFQALPPDFSKGLGTVGVDRILLTASGGPFLDLPVDELRNVTPEQACKHPNWDMGRKISVDSATLMNKGLELIEAHWLFNAEPAQLEVLIHPQSIIHSMVAYRDGSVLAQLGTPDMRTPIAFTLAWPERIEAGVERLNLADMNDLSFRKPDLDRFPCLGLAYDAMNEGGNLPVTLNAANEVAVEAFLQEQIRFDQIPGLVGSVMDAAERLVVQSLEDVIESDTMARQHANEKLKRLI